MESLIGLGSFFVFFRRLVTDLLRDRDGSSPAFCSWPLLGASSGWLASAVSGGDDAFCLKTGGDEASSCLVEERPSVLPSVAALSASDSACSRRAV